MEDLEGNGISAETVHGSVKNFGMHNMQFFLLLQS